MFEKMYQFRFTRRALVAILALAIVANGVQADIVLKVSPMSITLVPSVGWTIKNMTWNLYPMMIEPSSQNGTVLSVDGTWAGSGHGNETVISAMLRVDGIAKSIVDGSTYSGTTIEFDRITNLGGAYRLTDTLTINGSGTYERVMLDGLDATKSIDVGNAYAFLGTRIQGMNHYAAYTADRNMIYSGTNVADNSFTYLAPAVAIAQYDPTAQIGVVSEVTVGRELGLNPFIWNRGYDWKLYEEFAALEGPAFPTKHFVFEQRMTAFQAAPDKWMATAASLVAPEPGALELLVFGITIIAIVARVTRQRAAYSPHAHREP